MAYVQIVEGKTIQKFNSYSKFIGCRTIKIEGSITHCNTAWSNILHTSVAICFAGSH